MTKPRLQIIIGTTRPGRQGPNLAKWLAEQAEQHGAFEVELVDIADYNLPVFDEPHHPRLHNYTKDHTKKWSEKIAEGDAYIFVTAEYDHMPPPSLLNAITYLSQEWHYKPASFLSYGGVSGGTRAVTMMLSILATVRVFPILETIPLPNYWQQMDEEGVFHSNELIDASVKSTLNELVVMEKGLKTIRNK